MEMIIENSHKEFNSEANYDNEDEGCPLRCWDCNINFTSETFLYSHIYRHIKQPSVLLERISLPPLKLTLKHSSAKGFEIIKSPRSSPLLGQEDTFKLEEKISATATTDEEREDSTSGYNGSNIDSSEFDQETMSSHHFDDDDIAHDPNKELDNETTDLSNEYQDVDTIAAGMEEDIDHQNINFNTEIETDPLTNESNELLDEGDLNNEGENNSSDNNAENMQSESTERAEENEKDSNSEPTSPASEKVSPSPEYPKIRIKTTGLLKESSVKITEITDNLEEKEIGNRTSWNSAEDPLKITETDNMMSLFNNNERAQDLGFCSSDSEFISLDRFDDTRNSGQLQLYNHNSASNNIDSLTGLPMQALAQQVSRLKPNSSSGMHQQNVLINIQQFPSMPPPPQPHYQPPMIYPHHAPHPNQYHYQYQPPPPNPYYPSTAPYPGQHMQPPPHPMGGAPSLQQHPQSSLGHHATSHLGHQFNSQSPQDRVHHPGHMQMPSQQPYRPQIQQPPRSQVPGLSTSTSGNRMPSGVQTAQRSRAPNMLRQQSNVLGPRIGAGGQQSGIRANCMRPGNNANQLRQQLMQQKRPIDQKTGILDAKKKKFDILAPEKDDEDCQVICMQPKNTDGGLPQIENVQGGTPEPTESSIMNLPDSISLTVRNQAPKDTGPKKSDAKEVANILATRGITVTAAPKPKEKPQQQAKTISSSMNLNSAVSLIPSSAKSTNKANNVSNGGNSDINLPTVDLTDESTPTPVRPSQPSMPQKRPMQKTALPFRCDLCNAQYPNSMGLMKHRQNFHKTNTGMSDFGIPLINLKQPGIMQRLALLGISNYIPVPGQEGQSFALPIINTRNANNMSAIGATQMLTLGQIRSIPHIPRANANNGNNAVRMPINMQKR